MAKSLAQIREIRLFVPFVISSIFYEIIDAHPYLDLAKVHDALSYYYEHRGDLDAEIRTRIQDVEELRAKIQSEVWKTA